MRLSTGQCNASHCPSQTQYWRKGRRRSREQSWHDDNLLLPSLPGWPPVSLTHMVVTHPCHSCHSPIWSSCRSPLSEASGLMSRRVGADSGLKPSRALRALSLSSRRSTWTGRSDTWPRSVSHLVPPPFCLVLTLINIPSAAGGVLQAAMLLISQLIN